MGRNEEKKLHAADLIRFGMKYWEDPLAQEYFELCVSEKAPKYFWIGFIAGTGSTIFVSSLILLLLR